MLVSFFAIEQAAGKYKNRNMKYRQYYQSEKGVLKTSFFSTATGGITIDCYLHCLLVSSFSSHHTAQTTYNFF